MLLVHLPFLYQIGELTMNNTFNLDKMLSDTVFIKNLYKRLEEHKRRHELIMKIEESNKEEVVIPFLDVLGSEYYYLNHELILIKEKETKGAEVENRLIDLGFIPRNKIPNIKVINQRFNKTLVELPKRYFSEYYLMDFHIVDHTEWDKVKLALSIMAKLFISKNDRKFVNIFCSILGTL